MVDQWLWLFLYFIYAFVVVIGNVYTSTSSISNIFSSLVLNLFTTSTRILVLHKSRHYSSVFIGLSPGNLPTQEIRFFIYLNYYGSRNENAEETCNEEIRPKFEQ